MIEKQMDEKRRNNVYYSDLFGRELYYYNSKLALFFRTFRKQISENFNKFRCEISGNLRTIYKTLIFSVKIEIADIPDFLQHW